MKQGKYELDAEGNLVEVGDGGVNEITPRGWPTAPAAKARIRIEAPPNPDRSA